MLKLSVTKTTASLTLFTALFLFVYLAVTLFGFFDDLQLRLFFVVWTSTDIMGLVLRESRY